MRSTSIDRSWEQVFPDDITRFQADSEISENSEQYTFQRFEAVRTIAEAVWVCELLIPDVL